MKKLYLIIFISGFFLAGCTSANQKNASTDKPAIPVTKTIVKSVVKPVFNQIIQPVKAQETKTKPDYALEELRQASLSIDGMWCASCSYGIQYALKSKEGVVDAKIGFGKDFEGIGEVIYHPDLISKDDIVKSAEPYTMVIVSDNQATAKSLQ